jgi:hypothetical protein
LGKNPKRKGKGVLANINHCQSNNTPKIVQ